ncbi:hypothetical protein LAZ67_15000497 [Cordylochernes scorpioides]|uniref:Integrase catalytic domain-containing protein n=1 Tax=Cordylochernes scorpioides TaxID=51811 RepID=A0ABY6L838_9ARAC|nr:hypothetical protein LAZ67_15000497 [Cordylochernes scorpioides]
MLEGRTFKIFTDHKPLVFAFKQRNDKASPRQVRQLQYISQFSTDIIYIKGEQNIVADNLSRIEDITKIIDYDEIAKEQDKDKGLIELINSNKSLKFKRYPLPSGKSLWCDTSTENIRPFVPKQFRMKIFQQIHGLSHPGIKTSVKDMTSRFIWPDIKRNIKEWAQTCIQCQRNKTSRHTKSEIKQFKEPDERFSTAHIDLIGPFPPSNEYVYCLTCIDRFTGWIEAIPIRSETAETVARAFYEGWITRFGVPYEVITDQGRQFTSELFKTLATLCGVKLKHTTAYHPQSNGKIERFHRTLKAAIRAHNSNKWTESIPTVLLGLRAALRKDSDYSLTQMVYGKTIKLPGEFFDAPKISTNPETFLHKLQKQMESLKPKLTRHNTSPKIFVFKDLETCSHVFLKTCRVRKSLEPAYEGPFKVTSRTDKYFSIEIKGKEINVSIDRLKPAYILKEEEDIATTPGVAGDPRLAPPGEDKEPSASAAPKMSRSGRTIRTPVRFRDKVECYPVIRKESLRVIVALAAELNLTIKSYDVKTAYLNGELKETIFMKQSVGIVQKDEEYKVRKLLKSIYGLPQSGRCWNKRINEILSELGMIRSRYDPCVYTLQKGREFGILGLYVDDLLITGTDQAFNDNLALEIGKFVDLKEKEENEPFISIEIRRTEHGYDLSQSHYINKILRRFGLEECNIVQTPGDRDQNFDEYKDSKPVDKTLYQEMIGSLMYLTTGTRPDISYNVSNLSQYNNDNLYCGSDGIHVRYGEHFEFLFDILCADQAAKKSTFRHLLFFAFHRGQKSAEAARDICKVYGKGLLYWEMLERNATVNKDLYIAQLHRVKTGYSNRKERIDKVKSFSFMTTLGRMLHKSSKPPFKSSNGKFYSTRRSLRTLHQPIHLFRSMSNHMIGTTFDDEEDLKPWLNNFFDTRPDDFWRNGINKLVERWEEVVNNNGEYIIDQLIVIINVFLYE